MAKRGLCILLAVLTLFALAIPAFAAEEVVAENEPKQAAAPTSGSCGSNVKWSLSGGTLTISGTGKMTDYAWDGAPWYKVKDQIKKVVVKSGVTSIGDEAFNECTNMTSLTIPNTVTRIGLAAAWGCTSLTSVTIPASVTYIDEIAFSSCENLASVTLPSSVTTIRTGAFDHTPWLENLPGEFAGVNGTLFDYRGNAAKVTIPSSVTSIAGAFWRCENMTSVTIPSSVKTLDHSAFEGCIGLTSITIPGTVTSIGLAAFYECTGLKSVTISNGVKTIDTAAFQHCGNLTSVTIPDSVTSIGPAAFNDCTSLTSIKVSNPKCVIDAGDDTTLGVPGTTVVQGYAGSTAEAYAKKNGYTFKAIDSKPTQLAAPAVKIAQTDGGIKVTWNAVKGSPQYMVYYKENGGKWQQIGTTSKTSYTHAAKKLKNGATYQFTVRCCDSDKKTLLSPYKASNSVKYIVELAAPAVKIAQTKSGIQVTWNAVSGSPQYMVYYKENGGSWTKIGTTSKTSYTHDAKKLKNGATYQFTVRCCASDKKTLLSPYKASNSLKYIVELAAPAVKIAQVSGGIQVTWNAVSGSPQYVVYYKENGGKWQTIGTTSKTSYTHAAKKLKNGATYQFTVRCCASDKKTLLSDYAASNSLKYKK